MPDSTAGAVVAIAIPR
ncbi:hypothetical protein A2U01_0103259, partial [Trifolium medium]|nr:hypothetical protein [Trifolium medium]